MEVNKNGDLVQNGKVIQEEQHIPLISIPSIEILQEEHDILVIVINTGEIVQKEQDVSMIPVSSSEIVHHEQDNPVIEVNSGEFVQEVLNKTENGGTTKQNRMKCFEYNGYFRQIVHDKYEIKQNVTRLARHRKLTCKSAICIRSSIRLCSQFSESERKAMFSLLWNMSWDQKKCMCLMKFAVKARCTTKGYSRRAFTYTILTFC